WPPSLLLTAAARSRLTFAPGPSPPMLERARVSPITSTVNVSPSTTSTTVRQTPLTAIESPCPASEVTSLPRMVNRAESANCSVARISPSSSTMPVNMPYSVSSYLPVINSANRERYSQQPSSPPSVTRPRQSATRSTLCASAHR